MLGSRKLAVLEFFSRSVDCTDVSYVKEERKNKSTEFFDVFIAHIEGEGGYNRRAEYRIYPKSDAEIEVAGQLCRDIMDELDRINLKEDKIKFEFVQRDEDFAMILHPLFHSGNECYTLDPERASMAYNFVDVLRLFKAYICSLNI